MILYADFHIHTALSPCGDRDMTPNNIVNMALLKELDIIKGLCEAVFLRAQVRLGRVQELPIMGSWIWLVI